MEVFVQGRWFWRPSLLLGEGTRDHLGCAKGLFGLGDGKDLTSVRELVQALSWPYLQTSCKPWGCLQPFLGSSWVLWAGVSHCNEVP